MDRQPGAGRQELRVARGESGHEQPVESECPDRDGRAAIARQAWNERPADPDSRVRVDDDADDVGAEEAEDEQPDILVPREQALRELPGRLVDGMAQDQADDDLDSKQDETEQAGRPRGEPDPELGLMVGT